MSDADPLPRADAQLGRPASAPQGRPQPNRPEPLLVNADGARAVLGGISRTTLDKLVRKGEIPCVRLAGRVMFSIEQLKRIANGGKVGE
jgi:hypothetical protein